MTVRRLDENGDIATSGQQFITGVDEIAQTIRTRVKLFLGEYFRDTTEGTPWFQQILSKSIAMETKESILRTRIARTDGVVRITSFDTDFEQSTRVWSVTAGVLTTYGYAEIVTTGII